MPEIIYKEESFRIMGACFEVYREKGPGFHEPVYQECLELEFGIQQLPCIPHVQLPLSYKNRMLRQKFIPDFICYDKIILEIKAVECLCDAHRSQVISYLHATGFKLGILVNFGSPHKLEYERLVI